MRKTGKIRGSVLEKGGATVSRIQAWRMQELGEPADHSIKGGRKDCFQSLSFVSTTNFPAVPPTHAHQVNNQWGIDPCCLPL